MVDGFDKTFTRLVQLFLGLLCFLTVFWIGWRPVPDQGCLRSTRWNVLSGFLWFAGHAPLANWFSGAVVLLPGNVRAQPSAAVNLRRLRNVRLTCHPLA